MLILECSQGCYVVNIWPVDLDLWPMTFKINRVPDSLKDCTKFGQNPLKDVVTYFFIYNILIIFISLFIFPLPTKLRGDIVTLPSVHPSGTILVNILGSTHIYNYLCNHRGSFSVICGHILSMGGHFPTQNTDLWAYTINGRSFSNTEYWFVGILSMGRSFSNTVE
jgi:hypothetical protein